MHAVPHKTIIAKDKKPFYMKLFYNRHVDATVFKKLLRKHTNLVEASLGRSVTMGIAWVVHKNIFRQNYNRTWKSMGR